MQTANQILQQGRYRITQPFEPNGTSAFYKAFDEIHKTDVILKESQIRLNKVTTPAQQETLKHAFAAEAQKLTEIKHEGFLRVCDFFSEIDRQYLVLEAVDGDSLSELIERNKRPFALSDVANWADELLDALNYLHTLAPPIIHRDIKPQNIKLALNGRVKLDISGLGKGSQAKIGATVTNQNLHFLPLEQIWERLDSASQQVVLNSYDEKSEEILKQPSDARSDIYALGATLYHLLTARLPLDPLERSIDILEGKPDPLPTPNRLNPNVPPEISDAIMKAMEIRRENRFDSAPIMRQVLRTAFLRVKERNAEKTLSPATSAAAINSTEQKIQITEQDILEIEAEPIPQIDLIKRLQEAEARRLEAEKRAAEAEKRLLEKETQQIEKPAIPASAVKREESFASSVTAGSTSPVMSNASPAKETHPASSSILFAEPPKQSGGLKKLAVAAAILFVFAGAGFGVWSLLQSKSVEPKQTISTQVSTSNETAKPAPTATVETETAPTIEPPVEQVAAETVPAVETDPAKPAAAAVPVIKNKPAAAPKVQKQAVPPPAKTGAPEKKPVTVDDLINDN